MKEKIKALLQAQSPQKVFLEGFKPSAVLLPLIQKDKKIQILYTLRSQKVASHKGQISFPGGFHEKEDKDLIYTALRETEEEVGIPIQKVEVLGQLDEAFTPRGYHITPFVGWIQDPIDLKINEEIEQAFWINLDELMDPKNLRLEEKEFQGKSYPFPFYQIGEYTIWGATGRITYSLLERIKKQIP
ncbi:MAG: CoA pyrophosphatase [Deltaproteobacteria bacterium]|nr:CoA pyrophosphatase [Deltaproteobacteria bacterium]